MIENWDQLSRFATQLFQTNLGAFQLTGNVLGSKCEKSKVSLSFKTVNEQSN